MNHPENQRYGKRIPGDTSFSMNEHSGKEPKQLHLEKLENSHVGKQKDTSVLSHAVLFGYFGAVFRMAAPFI